MLNQIILVGRLTKDPELTVCENGKKKAIISLAVPRNYKNLEGVYETDYLDCTLWTGIAENTSEYCQTGDMIGLKGRIQTRLIENEDGTKRKKTEIVGEKVTFLSSAQRKGFTKKENNPVDETEKVNKEIINDNNKSKNKEKNKDIK